MPTSEHEHFVVIEGVSGRAGNACADFVLYIPDIGVESEPPSLPVIMSQVDKYNDMHDPFFLISDTPGALLPRTHMLPCPVILIIFAETRCSVNLNNSGASVVPLLAPSWITTSPSADIWCEGSIQ